VGHPPYHLLCHPHLQAKKEKKEKKKRRDKIRRNLTEPIVYELCHVGHPPYHILCHPDLPPRTKIGPEQQGGKVGVFHEREGRVRQREEQDDAPEIAPFHTPDGRTYSSALYTELVHWGHYEKLYNQTRCTILHKGSA